MDEVLRIQNLSKNYGRVHAVNNLSLQVPEGSVYGILGPNGSGKTTTLGMILDVINPTSGSFTWFGKSASKENRKILGAILETPNFYPYLSAEKNLEIVATIKHIGYSHIERVLKITDLWERRKDHFSTFSLGMKQRLALASALLNEPLVLILDEPTNGLDPQGIAEVRNLILKIAASGTTIIIASHLLDEVQKVCTHVAVLKSGNIIFQGRVDEILGSAKYVEVGASDLGQLGEVLLGSQLASNVQKEGDRLVATLYDGVSVEDVSKHLFSKGISITHIAERKISLEKQFLDLLADTK